MGHKEAIFTTFLILRGWFTNNSFGQNGTKWLECKCRVQLLASFEAIQEACVTQEARNESCSESRKYFITFSEFQPIWPSQYGSQTISHTLYSAPNVFFVHLQVKTTTTEHHFETLKELKENCRLTYMYLRIIVSRKCLNSRIRSNF